MLEIHAITGVEGQNAVVNPFYHTIDSKPPLAAFAHPYTVLQMFTQFGLFIL